MSSPAPSASAAAESAPAVGYAPATGVPVATGVPSDPALATPGFPRADDDSPSSAPGLPLVEARGFPAAASGSFAVGSPAPPRALVVARDPRQFTTGLFDCASGDAWTCAYGALCPVLQISQSAERTKAGDGCATCFVIVALLQLNRLAMCVGNLAAGSVFAHVHNRVALNYGIEERVDGVVGCACAPCVSCRVAREIRARDAMGQAPVDVVRHVAEHGEFPLIPLGGMNGTLAAPVAMGMEARRRERRRRRAGGGEEAEEEAGFAPAGSEAGGTAPREPIVTYTAVVSRPEEDFDEGGRGGGKK